MGATWWADVLATRLQISKGAARRIKYAEVFGARTALTGEPLAPRLAHVAAAQARGQIGSEHLRVIARFFEDLSAHLDAHTRDQVEADRADIATGSGARAVAQAADRLALPLNQDGDAPTDAERARRRYLRIGAQGADGMSHITGLLDPEARATLDAVLAKWAAPEMCDPDDPSPTVDGDPDAHAKRADLRSQPQLLQELESGHGQAVTGGGTLLPMADVIRLASDAHHYLVIFDRHTQQPLYLGRSKRIASAGQRIVLYACPWRCGLPPSHGLVRVRFCESCLPRFAPGLTFRLSCVAVPDMNRRRMMLMTGIGALAAAIPVPEAGAYPSRRDTPADRVPPPTAPPGGAAQGTYLFHDEFDGPAGSAPDPSKWTVSRARESMQDPTFWELPENVGQYRDDPRNVFVDGKSNLVIRAAKDGSTYYSGKVFSPWEGSIGTTWEARIKLDCLTAGCWPAWWLSSDAQGEIDVLEWYGNGTWASGTTVHSKANGAEWATHKLTFDSGWHTWRLQWDDAGMRFWKDYVDGAQPYFNVPAHSIADWPFNDPGYRVYPILNLAVAGSGGGDPGPGTYPAEMLVDWIRVW